jgi:hypothetical protein
MAVAATICSEKLGQYSCGDGLAAGFSSVKPGSSRHGSAMNGLSKRPQLSLTYRTGAALISIAVPILVWGSGFGNAATPRQVARCRSMQVDNFERRDCFKSLGRIYDRVSRRRGPASNANDEDNQPPHEMPVRKTTPGSSGDAGNAHDDGQATKQSQPAKQIGDVPKTTDDPKSSTSIRHPGIASGQSLCVDQSSLAASIIAGVLASSSDSVMPTNGCDAIPKDANIEILEHYPSGFGFVRVVRVKITNPSDSNSTIGYTIEVDVK